MVNYFWQVTFGLKRWYMTAHNIACKKCLKVADFYMESENILGDADKIMASAKWASIWHDKITFKVVTSCPHCDEIYILDGSA